MPIRLKEGVQSSVTQLAALRLMGYLEMIMATGQELAWEIALLSGWSI